MKQETQLFVVTKYGSLVFSVIDRLIKQTRPLILFSWMLIFI